MLSKKLSKKLELLNELNDLLEDYIEIKVEKIKAGKEEVLIDRIKGVGSKTKNVLQEAGIKTAKELAKSIIDDIVTLGIGKTTAKKIINNATEVLEYVKPTQKINEENLHSRLKEFNKKNPKLKKYSEHMIQTFEKTEIKEGMYNKDILILNNLAILAVNNYLPMQDILALKKSEIEDFSKKANIHPVLMKVFIASLKYKVESTTKPSRKGLSKIQIYNRLLESGYQNGADIVKQNPTKLGMQTGICHHLISGMHQAIILGTPKRGLHDTLKITTKDFSKKTCCPPYEALMWREKYDYLTEDNALRKLMNLVKENVSETVKQIISQKSYMFPLLEKYGLYDITDPIGNNVDVSKDFKYLEQANDVALTKQVVNETLDNLEKELLAIKSKMKVSRVWAVINTDDPSGPFGGGDKDAVHLDIIDSDNHPQSIKPTHGTGYDDGGTAIFGYPEDTIPLLNIFTTNGNLNLKKIRLKYTSGNKWHFGSMYVIFIYEDQSSRILNLLNPDQIPYNWDELAIYSWDTVLDDKVSGTIDNDCFEYKLVRGINIGTTCGNPFNAPLSNFNRVFQETKDIKDIMNDIRAAIQEAAANNIFLLNYDKIDTSLQNAATDVFKQEYSAAIDKYIYILDLVKILLSKPNLLSFEKEFLFAIYVLIADTYLEEGNYGFAYSYYNEAYKYLVEENNDYLWLKVANLFVKWGDSLYAHAGSDYERRLHASKKYQKVANGNIILTYRDGCEHEVKELWMDVGTISNAQSDSTIMNWIRSLKIGLYSSSWSPEDQIMPAVDSLLHITKVELIKDHDGVSLQSGFIRVTFDVSEIEINRDNLKFGIVNTENNFSVWEPEWVRFQVGYEKYNPLASKNREYYGSEQNIQVFEFEIEKPLKFRVEERPFYLVLWSFILQYPKLTVKRLKPGTGCEYNYFIKYARLRLDQITNHLNFLNIHDEYVPAHRFQELYKDVLNLANRAVSLQLRYIDFKSRAENETLSLMEAAHLTETAQINLDISRERVKQANLNMEAAFSQLSASQSVVGQARDALDLYEDTHLNWWERYNNATSAGYPGGISTNIGGGYSALTGNGYDESFALQRHQHKSELERAKAAVRQAEFNFGIAELELLISEKLVELESARFEFAKDRINFLQNKEMNATFFYLIASLYKSLTENVIQSATRLAYLAERALEFEINQSINIIRMDYFQLSLGSELLLTDIDYLSQKLIEFRERYRDIPNIIEREFYFSRDFHEQFRILTSSEPSPDMIDVPDGLRRVEFTTPMVMYDKKIPGRYAFGRILGVEMEIQGDVGEGVVTGYLENANFIETEIEGETKTIRHSYSLVRVPKPVLDERPEECEPIVLLKSDIPLFGKFIFIPPIYHGEILFEEPKRGEMLEAQLDKFIEMGNEYKDDFSLHIAQDPEIGNIFGNIDPIPDFILTNSDIHKEMFLFAGMDADPIGDRKIKELTNKANKAGIGIDHLKATSQLVGSDIKKSVEAVNTYLKSQELSFVVNEKDIPILEKIKGLKTGFSKEEFQDTIGTSLLKKTSQSWKRYRYGWDTENSTILYKDLTKRYSANASTFAYIEDYVDYKDHSPKYVLRIKNHDADRQSLSTYNRKEDAVVFNPYNSQDMLGVFENTGIHMGWNLTLIARTNDRNEPRFVYDKIREIILRVWYHAANERDEGPELADLVEKSVMKLNNLRLVISFYKDYYDEFTTLVGDYPDDVPDALGEIRKYTDISHPSLIPEENGWIKFDIDEKLIPFDDRKIRSTFLIFNSSDPDQLPDYEWYLRKEIDGPVFRCDSSVNSLGDLKDRMSNIFAGVNPRGTWYFRLAESDNNEGKSLEFIRDIEFIIEYSL